MLEKLLHRFFATYLFSFSYKISTSFLAAKFFAKVFMHKLKFLECITNVMFNLRMLWRIICNVISAFLKTVTRKNIPAKFHNLLSATIILTVCLLISRKAINSATQQ